MSAPMLMQAGRVFCGQMLGLATMTRLDMVRPARNYDILLPTHALPESVAIVRWLELYMSSCTDAKMSFWAPLRRISRLRHLM